LRALAILTALGLLSGFPEAPESELHRETRLVMGTTAELGVAGVRDTEAALDSAFAALDRVDASMTSWRPSELTRLNDAGSAEVSPELLAVLLAALDVARASGGAFDPTVEPLVRARGGFGEQAVPLGESAQARLANRVGYERVRIDALSRIVRLAPGTRLDLGGIAKGYAADLALRALRDAGAKSGFVDLGTSSLAVFGAPVEIEARDPEGDGSPWAAFRVAEGGIGTAGGEQRPGHLIDPRTGEPVDAILAATVVAATAMEADALATAACVLGAEAGLELLVRRGAAGFVLRREEGQARISATPGFAARYGVAVRESVRWEEVALSGSSGAAPRAPER